jgi:hypothetical protein
MSEERVIIEMTSFIFEDGNTYYFKIFNRPSSRDFRDLYVYEKVITKSKSFWGKEKITEEFVKLNDSAELIDIVLDTRSIKNKIKSILIATKASYKMKDWDGFVGDIPDEIKKSLTRDNKLNDLGIL